MPLNIQIRDLATGNPVKPDFQPRFAKEKAINVRRRASVKSFRDLSQVNQEISRGTPLDIGFNATKVARQFQAGKIDILA